MDLYHADIRLPEGFRPLTNVVRPVYSNHAKRAAQTDRYGLMELPEYVNLKGAEVIEVGMEKGRVIKILFRMPYDDRLDMCIVLMPGQMWYAKTVWFNERTDTHRTLDRSKYVN